MRREKNTPNILHEDYSSLDINSYVSQHLARDIGIGVIRHVYLKCISNWPLKPHDRVGKLIVDILVYKHVRRAQLQTFRVNRSSTVASIVR